MTAKAAPHGVSARPSLARGRSETTVDVRRWEVRARGTARRVMASDQIRRQARAATGRKRWAAATTAPRPAPARRRDGSACRSGNGRPPGVRGRPRGWEGGGGPGGGGGARGGALAPAARGAMFLRCTWPNETASWNASANSARYAPNLERDRNQRIVVTLHASDAAAEPFCRHA